MKNLYLRSLFLSIPLLIFSGCSLGDKESSKENPDLIVQISNLDISFPELAHHFGNVESASKTQKIVINNDTSDPIEMNLSMDKPNPFVIQRSDCPVSPAELGAGKSCFVNVVFSTRGLFDGSEETASLTLSEGSEGKTIGLSAVVKNGKTAPNETETELVFEGDLPTIENPITNVYLRNIGLGNATIQELTFDDNVVKRFDACPVDKVLKPKESCRIQLIIPREERPSFESTTYFVKYADVTNSGKTLSPIKIIKSSISAGSEHTCGITEAGLAYCWGRASFGQLGDGDTLQRNVPTQVDLKDDEEKDVIFSSISAGAYHTCGITKAGLAYCWGSATSGRLGNGVISGNFPSPEEVKAPIEETKPLNFSSISAGEYHTCGITEDGLAYCWGSATSGEIGSGATQGNYPSPEKVLLQNDGIDVKFSSISAGEYHTCGITEEGLAYCWGYAANGRLGEGSENRSTVPSKVDLKDDEGFDVKFSSISAGGSHTCGITEEGLAYCWGDGEYGQIGDGSSSQFNVPTQVLLKDDGVDVKFSSISAGGQHTCGITKAGLAYCWGSATYGRLGNGVISGDFPSPVEVKADGEATLIFSSISAGWRHTCGITQAGLAYCWGHGQYGRIGTGVGSGSFRYPVEVNYP